MDRAKNARETMGKRANCAQSTLTAFSEDFGLNKNTAFSIAQGFGGGMHIDSICGAVTGAYMALGLANPVSEESPRQSMDKTNALINEFNRKFKELHGALTCTELLGYNLSRPEALNKARESGVFLSKCPVFVGDAVKIVEQLLKLE
ncbi:MAG: C-GCAxxG-C-C family protein [Dehalococcoidales bacterium]